MHIQNKTLLLFPNALKDETKLRRDDEKLAEDVIPIFLGGV